MRDVQKVNQIEDTSGVKEVGAKQYVQVANVARFSGPNKPPFWTFHWGAAMIFFMKISRLTIPELVWRNDLYDSWSEVNQAAYRPSKQKKVVMTLVRELSLASHKVRHQQIQTFNVIQYIIRS